ncbi:IS110 family transposase [Adhaeribacter swui]|uniref:IS110 family transposase n=1 Tax=Adhaeribacter swui TaxID=2086471 RepID=A0A7G7GB83_9BACT|nr:IS110 family transposase [Adhaeribacter swui]QNF31403.1 IS110 family transposase [Adhaeribacter swui]QNF34417.1 IS110 family transposase [Adhaeribacter swui]
MISPVKQKVIGIDVSKDSLAVCFSLTNKLQHLEVSNDKAGFQKLVKQCGVDCLYVMEATGIYYLQLAYYLYEQGAQVFVVNPVIIKRFIQMHLGKGKSDKKDAQWIQRYGEQSQATSWQPEQPVIVECRQLEQVAEQLIKQRTMVINALEALKLQPVVSSLATKSLLQTLKMLDKQVKQIQEKLLETLEKAFAKELNLLTSIPGIGRKTAGMLLLFTGDFQKLDNYRQLIAKAGLSPREYTSGTSIRGKVRITKMGGSLIRSKLYVCSFSAKKSNAACKALYERLVAKGKNGKLALIAVCNKLLKQAFAIVKSGIPYHPNYMHISTPKP